MNRHWMIKRGRRRGRSRWRLVTAVVIASGLLALGSGVSSVAASTNAVAQTQGVSEFFQAPGPWEVTQASADVPAANGVTIFHPTDLGDGGFQHPILTAAFLEADQLEHLASWGNVVVATDEPNPGGGGEILAAAQWAVDQNGDPESIFFGTLATDKVGAVGFSQGAGGVINATVNSGGLITSTIPIAQPNRVFVPCNDGTDALPGLIGCGDPPQPDWSQLTGSVLWVTGAADLTSNPDVGGEIFPGFSIPPGIGCLLISLIFGIPCNADDQQFFYDQTPPPAAKVEAIGVQHEVPTFYMGYLTAWFKYTLENDDFARNAFAGASPQIASDPAWTDWMSKGLP